MLERKTIRSANEKTWNELTDEEQVTILRTTFSKAFARVHAQALNVRLYDEIKNEHINDLRMYGSSRLLSIAYIRACEYAEKKPEKTAVYIAFCANIYAVYSVRDEIIGKRAGDGSQKEYTSDIQTEHADIASEYDDISEADFKMDLEMVLNTNTDRLIIDLRKDGYTLQEISSKTNVSYSYAQRLIKNLEKVLKN